jgi:hypothetical protein
MEVKNNMTERKLTEPFYWRTLDESERATILQIQVLTQAAANWAIETGEHLLRAEIDTPSGQPLPHEIINLLTKLDETYPLSLHEIPVEIREQQVDIVVGLTGRPMPEAKNIAVMRATKIPPALNALKNLRSSKSMLGYNVSQTEWVKL